MTTNLAKLYISKRIPEIGDVLDGKGVLDVWSTKYWDHCFVLFKNNTVGVAKYSYNYNHYFKKPADFIIAICPYIPGKSGTYSCKLGRPNDGTVKFHSCRIRLEGIKSIWEGSLYSAYTSEDVKVIVFVQP